MWGTTHTSATRNSVEPRLDGLTTAAVEQLQKAACAIRDGAEPLARQALDVALAHSDLGNTQQAAGDMAAAFESWRRACTLASDAPMPWFNFGRHLQQHGDTDAAIERCTGRPSWHRIFCPR